MNCAEWERLLDAYLDRHLTGALRLEFDAHRLGCRRCQQTLSMMEACEHVIAGDKPPVALSEDFTDQLMVHIAAAAPRPARAAPLQRVFRLAAVVLPAAAVVLLALYLPNWRSRSGSEGVAAPDPRIDVVSATDLAKLPGGNPLEPGIDLVEQQERGRAIIVGLLEQRIRAPLAAGKSLSADAIRMAQYLNLDLPPDVARQSVDFATVNPIGGIFFQLFGPAPAPETPESEPAEAAEATRI